jgi:predicted nuclease of predicted toxin-antitoxin system
VALRFKLDENLPRDAEGLFLRAGHSVETVLAEQLGGEADSSVLEACRRENRILVTCDLDFADTRAYPPAGLPGIWILRPATQSFTRTLALLSRALQLIATESPQHRLWIIDDARVRIRE